jgi:hypothetical protein
MSHIIKNQILGHLSIHIRFSEKRSERLHRAISPYQSKAGLDKKRKRKIKQ